MDIEQLKIVIDAIKSVSGDAQTLAIWWIIIDKLIPIFAWLIVAFGLYRILSMTIQNIGYSRYLRQIRDMLGVGTRGPIIEREAEEILHQISKLLNKD